MLFGVEWNFRGDEYLLYGIDKEWLLKYPHMLEWSYSELFEHVSEAKGIVIQAHPFRDRDYISKIRLHPETVHGIELVNAGNDPEFDRMAKVYADHFGFKVTAGSDLHRSICPARGLKGVISPRRLKTSADYAELIRSGNYRLYVNADDAGPIQDGDVVTKPVEMKDYYGNDITGGIYEIMGDRFNKPAKE